MPLTTSSADLPSAAIPPPLRSSYFILRLDFSCVDPTGTPEDMKRSLYDHINVRIENVLRYYRDNGFDLDQTDVHPENALATMESLLSVTQSAGHAVFLLIDEYDNFANTIMMQPTLDSRNRYEAVVHDERLLRTVFKVVKASTSGTGFDRVFITGVSPVVMSDITSGHNIAENLFLEPEFWDLCGFREEEVAETLSRIAGIREHSEDKAKEALLMMRNVVQRLQLYSTGPSGSVQSYPLPLFFQTVPKAAGIPTQDAGCQSGGG